MEGPVFVSAFSPGRFNYSPPAPVSGKKLGQQSFLADLLRCQTMASSQKLDELGGSSAEGLKFDPFLVFCQLG